MDLISTHALRMEGDRGLCGSPVQPAHFYPRPPHGGRRGFGKQSAPVSLHFYPRPPHGGRRHARRHVADLRRISTHALRMEGDNSVMEWHIVEQISTHALRMEGDFPVRLRLLYG